MSSPNLALHGAIIYHLAMGSVSSALILKNARLIWAALLAGQVIFFVVILIMRVGDDTPPQDFESMAILFYMCCVMLVVLLPGAYMARRIVFRLGQRDRVIPPQIYLTGNLILWGMMEGVALFALVLVFISGLLWPFILPAVVAMAVQAHTYPDGRAMEATEAFPERNQS